MLFVCVSFAVVVSSLIAVSCRAPAPVDVRWARFTRFGQQLGHAPYDCTPVVSSADLRLLLYRKGKK